MSLSPSPTAVISFRALVARCCPAGALSSLRLSHPPLPGLSCRVAEGPRYPVAYVPCRSSVVTVVTVELAVRHE
jgi:hypothetical protein